MRRIPNLIIVCFVLSNISACKKAETVEVPVLNNPVNTISAMTGMKQWHGQYMDEKYDSTHTHIDFFQSDTSISFALTIANDSTILYNIFNSVDSLFYVRTNELNKSIFYFGHNSVRDVFLFYYYSADSMTFEMNGGNDSMLYVSLKLYTP